MDDIDNLRQELIESKTFCFHPFLELSINPAGHVKPCCYYDGYLYNDATNSFVIDGYLLHDSSKPNYINKDFNNTVNLQNKDTTLEKVWSGESIKLVRKELWEGKGDSLHACNICQRDGKASMRVRGINEYKNNREVLQLVKHAIENDFSVNQFPKRLELKPSNLCNLKCVMCNSYDSSQIAKELDELSEKYSGITIWGGRLVPKLYDTITPIIKGNNVVSDYDKHIIELKLENDNYSDRPEFWESFCKMVPNLETLSFAGGEPTLLPFVEKALLYCVETGHSKHITVFCSSNITNINKKFLKIIPQFKLFEMICSVDGYKGVQEYSRFPSKWSQIEKNYTELKSLMSHTNVKVLLNITVNSLNVSNLDEFLYWIEEQSQVYPYFSFWPFNLNLLWTPSYQQVTMLPIEVKNKAIEKLEVYKKTSKILQDFPGLDSKINLVINELQKHDPEFVKTNIEEFSKIIKVLDEHRKIDIDTYIPSLKGVYK